MLVGVPKEIKTKEYRVGLVPGSVRELIHHGHKVLIDTNAGAGIGYDDDAYRAAGAEVVGGPEEIFAKAEMVVKVKEPMESEYQRLRAGQVLFTYLHLAPDLKQTQGLIDSGCIGIAYETVTGARGGLPLLAPMSEVAGRMSVQVGAHCLEKEQGGSGMLLGGVPGVAAARVVIIGGVPRLVQHPLLRGSPGSNAPDPVPGGTGIRVWRQYAPDAGSQGGTLPATGTAKAITAGTSFCIVARTGLPFSGA